MRNSVQVLADKVEIPSEQEFIEADSDFIESKDLATLAAAILTEFDEFEWLLGKDEWTMRFFWKKEGGRSKGRDKLGECKKLTGLEAHFAKAEFVIWLAADHNRRITYRLDALMYHELRHIGQTEKGEPTCTGHEFEGFSAEFEHFGAWRQSMRNIVAASKQGHLFE